MSSKSSPPVTLQRGDIIENGRTKRNIVGWKRNQIQTQIWQFLPSLPTHLQSHRFSEKCVRRQCLFWILPLVDCVGQVSGVNFYESPQTHSHRFWWALTLTNDPTPQPTGSTWSSESMSFLSAACTKNPNQYQTCFNMKNEKHNFRAKLANHEELF